MAQKEKSTFNMFPLVDKEVTCSYASLFQNSGLKLNTFWKSRLRFFSDTENNRRPSKYKVADPNDIIELWNRLGWKGHEC